MKKLFVFLMVVGLVIAGSGMALATFVALDPNTLTVAPGSMVTVSVDMTVDSDITMGAITTRILYDPNVFTYDDAWVVVQGDLLKHNWDLSGGAPTPGELSVGGIDLAFGEGIAAGSSGKLFSFELKVKEDAKPGSSLLTWGVYDGFDNATAGFDYGYLEGEGAIDVILPPEATLGKTVEVSAVPIPPAVWLFGSGLVGLVVVRRRITK